MVESRFAAASCVRACLHPRLVADHLSFFLFRCRICCACVRTCCGQSVRVTATHPITGALLLDVSVSVSTMAATVRLVSEPLLEVRQMARKEASPAPPWRNWGGCDEEPTRMTRSLQSALSSFFTSSDSGSAASGVLWPARYDGRRASHTCGRSNPPPQTCVGCRKSRHSRCTG